MNRYSIEFEFYKETLLGSIPKSSTIFGSLCWSIKKFEGEEKLKLFLDKIEKNKGLIIGDLHPKEYKLIPINDKLPSDYKFRKKWKKAKYCKTKKISLTREFIDSILIKESFLFNDDDFFKKNYIARNNIKRTINKENDSNVEPYQLESFNLERTNLFEAVVDSDIYDKKELEKYFSYVKFWGLGKKITTGLGNIKEIRVKDITINSFRGACMALSNFIPKKNDPHNGFYKIDTTPSRGLDGTIYPKITRVQSRSLFFSKEQISYFGRCIRLSNNRLIYGISPVENITYEA